MEKPKEIHTIKGIIKAVSQPKEFNGVLQIGFNINDRWYNIPGTAEELKYVLADSIKKGSEIEFEYEPLLKIVDKVNVIKEAEKETEEGSWQDDMVNFEDLLTAAHEKAKTDKSNLIIETQMIGTVDFDKKKALFKAIVTITKEEKIIGRFEGHGDAEGIQSATILPHFIRMAETRAIARALRWYTNNAKCCDVETGNTKKA